MTTPSRTFRIFVSSTFSDLVAERNALQEHVFPRLRELCERHGARFQAIDLRWGVSEEAGLDQQTMKICLTEIARCQRVTPRPNFIILLGDRYGWRPLPYAIPADEMERMLPCLSQEERRLALWDAGAAFGSDQDAVGGAMVAWQDGNPTGERGWYRLDTNAVPAVYLLQPRPHDSPFADYGHWEAQAERPLHAILGRAARETFGTSADAEATLLKYAASATHQEIAHGALRVEDAAEHVFGFFRAVANLPDLTAELPARPACDYVDTTIEGTFDTADHDKLAGLRESLATQLGASVVEHRARWTGGGLTTDHIGTLPATLEECLKLNESPKSAETLCEAVWRRLSTVILAQVSALESVDPLVAEQEAHTVFGANRARLFVGRGDLLARAAGYLAGVDRHPLVIVGPSGSGKSALMAKIAARARERHPDALVVTRFIGATPGSSDGRTLLENLTRQIVRAYGGDESDIPPEYSALAFTFRDRLTLATAERPLILLVDALDQLSAANEAQRLAWLPAELPEHVRLIVSTLPDDIPDPVRRRLGRYAGERPFVPLQPLTTDDGAAILDGWLAEAQPDPLVGPTRQTLTAKQREDVLTKFAAAGGLPLHLRVAYEQARRWRSFDGLPSLSDEHPGLAADVAGVIRDLFWRLEQESNHGKALVSHALGYLAAAQHGLSEDELLDVLSADVEVLADFRRRSPNSPQSHRLPPVVWSRLYFDLEPYLAERAAPGGGALLSFYHRQVAEKTATDYGCGEDGIARHRGLAAYFGALPTWLDGEKTSGHPRKAAELAYQQMRGELWPELTATLTDFDFLEAVVRALSVYDLEADYRDALAAWGGAETDRGIVAAFEERLRLESHHIKAAPDLLFPQLYNHLTWLDKPDGPLHALCERATLEHTGWLRRLDDPRPAAPAWRLSLEGHTHWVNAVTFTRDGRIVSAGRDGTVRVWRAADGRLLHTLRGHADGVSALALTGHGWIVSGSWDETIKVWDIDSGRLVRTLRGHAAWVGALTLSQDGRLISAAGGPDSAKSAIMIWNLHTGQLLRVLHGHTRGVIALALTADGRIISGSHDSTVRIWDMETGQLLGTLKGHRHEVTAVVVTGGRIVSGSMDGTIRTWDPDTGKMLSAYRAHRGGVTSLAVLDRGLISGGADKAIRVWELPSGRVFRLLQGHLESVNAVAVSADGRVASGSSDHSVKVWDLASGRLLRSMEGHADEVRALAVTEEGHIVSGSADRTLKVWDSADGALLRSIKGAGAGIRALALAPTGEAVVGRAGLGHTIRVWDLATGQLVRSLRGHPVATTKLGWIGAKQLVSGSFWLQKAVALWDFETGRRLRTLRLHPLGVSSLATDGVRHLASGGAFDETVKVRDFAADRGLYTYEISRTSASALAISADGGLIIGCADGTLEVCNLYTGTLLCSMQGHYERYGMESVSEISSVAALGDGRIISASRDSTIRVWDVASGQLVASLEGHADEIKALTVGRDGRIISASADKTIKVWDIPAVPSGAPAFQPSIFAEGHTKAVEALAFGGDSLLISGSRDGFVKAWDAREKRLQKSFKAHRTAIKALAVDGCVIFSGSDDSSIGVYDLEKGRLVSSLSIHKKAITSLVLAAGHRLISGSVDTTVAIWDLDGQRLERTLEPHNGSVTCIATYDDWLIVSGSDRGSIGVWDLPSGRLVWTLKGHAAPVSALAVGSSGTLLSGAADGSLMVWDVTAGHLLARLEGHTGAVCAVVLAENGHGISAANDGTVRLWDLASGHGRVLLASDVPFRALALQSHLLAVGDEAGGVALFYFHPWSQQRSRGSRPLPPESPDLSAMFQGTVKQLANAAVSLSPPPVSPALQAELTSKGRLWGTSSWLFIALALVDLIGIPLATGWLLSDELVGGVCFGLALPCLAIYIMGLALANHSIAPTNKGLLARAAGGLMTVFWIGAAVTIGWRSSSSCLMLALGLVSLILGAIAHTAPVNNAILAGRYRRSAVEQPKGS